MGDIIDDANETADLHLRIALAGIKPAPVIPPPNGRCQTCAAEIDGGRWCDDICKDDYRKSRD